MMWSRALEVHTLESVGSSLGYYIWNLCLSCQKRIGLSTQARLYALGHPVARLHISSLTRLQV